MDELQKSDAQFPQPRKRGFAESVQNRMRQQNAKNRREINALKASSEVHRKADQTRIAELENAVIFLSHGGATDHLCFTDDDDVDIILAQIKKAEQL